MTSNEVPEVTNFFKGRDLKRKEIENNLAAPQDCGCGWCECSCGPTETAADHGDNTSDKGDNVQG